MEPENIAGDIEARQTRFLRELKANNLLMDCMNEVLDKSESAIKLKENQPECDLDLLVASMYGKAGKSYQAILRLCCSGFGEDALILLRSNVNVMINLSYILIDDSIKRAGDLIAFSHVEQKKYLRMAHGARPPWVEKLNWGKINKRAERWRALSIATRADKSNQLFHYDVGYRFYSSIEHSDAWALSSYILDNETSVKIGSEPSDKYVGIGLVHNFGVMADIFLAFCFHFKIPCEDKKAMLTEEWRSLGKEC